MNDDFYIGWENRAPGGIAKIIRRTTVSIFGLVLLVAVVLAISQRTIGVAVFEYGTPKQFTGILRLWPYPHLLVPRPTGLGQPETFSTYFLVAPLKYGLSAEALAGFDGKFVSLHGTLLYRGNETMIEVNRTDIAEHPEQKITAPLPQTVSLGKQTFAGEIVDSKCYFGAMNPGQLAPHRACAALCVSGGIPPVFVVPQTNGPPLYFLLTLPDGRPANAQVLDFIAEPLAITGEVQQQDGLLILRAAPQNFRRL